MVQKLPGNGNLFVGFDLLNLFMSRKECIELIFAIGSGKFSSPSPLNLGAIILTTLSTIPPKSKNMSKRSFNFSYVFSTFVYHG